jgi:hypothetical protein
MGYDIKLDYKDKDGMPGGGTLQGYCTFSSLCIYVLLYEISLFFWRAVFCDTVKHCRSAEALCYKPEGQVFEFRRDH